MIQLFLVVLKITWLFDYWKDLECYWNNTVLLLWQQNNRVSLVKTCFGTKEMIECSFKNDFNQLCNARRLKYIGINFAIIISKLTIWVYTFLLYIPRYITFFWFWGLFTCFVYARFFYQSINVLSDMFFYSYLGGMWKNLPMKYRVSHSITI